MLPTDNKGLKRVAGVAVAVALVFLGKDFLAQVMSVISTLSTMFTPAS